MTHDFTNTDADKAARAATGAAGSIEDHLRKPRRSIWVGLKVWFVVTVIVVFLTFVFAVIGQMAGWDVEQLSVLVALGLGIVGLVVVGIVYDGRMVLACIGWNILFNIIVAILVSG